MIENLIIIKGGAYTDVKKALRQWINLYSKDLQDDLTFQLFKNGRGNHVIQADERLDNERFFYLVNYLQYPEDIRYSIDIQGFTKGRDENQLNGKGLLVYISSTDNEYDNVFVATSDNENFKVDFGGRITEIAGERSYQEPGELHLESPETLKVNREEYQREAMKRSANSVGERFEILSILAVGLMMIGLVVNEIDSDAYQTYSLALGIGIGVWFYLDYVMLQSDKYYFYCFGIAAGYLLLSLALDENANLIESGAVYALTLLIVQKPLRLLFKAALKREPIVDPDAENFWDGIYSIILFASSVALPTLLISNR